MGNKEEYFPEAFTAVGGWGPKTTTRMLRLLGLRNNAVKEVVSLQTGNNNLRRHLTLAKDAKCWRCSLEEESSFYILCVGDAHASVRRRVLRHAYPDPAIIREAELRALLLFCQCAGCL